MNTKEELEYLFYEAKEDVNKYTRYAREAELAAKDLEVKLKNLEEKPWSPEDSGHFRLLFNGVITEITNPISDYQKFGTQGTQEQMEDLRNPMMHLASQHAWARERDGVQQFVEGMKNYHVVLSHNPKEIIVDWAAGIENETTIYMTEQDAKAYADMMNKGLIMFPYEVEL